MAILIKTAHIGIDEAGRGCLAGPVVAAAVLFSPGFAFSARLPGLDDSKKLTEARRKELAASIHECCSAYGIGLSWQNEIDRVNIRNATFRAMARAVFELAVRLEEARGDAALPPLVIDGNAVIPSSQWQACLSDSAPDGTIGERFLPPSLLRFPLRAPAMPEQSAVVGGDALVPSVSAASVLAKTARDSLLVRLDEEFPGYGLARHKGYGTKEHLAAIAAKGACALHRKTFRGVCPEQKQLPLF